MSYIDSYNLSNVPGFMDAFNEPVSTTSTAPINYQQPTNQTQSSTPTLNDILQSGYSDMKFPTDPPSSGFTYTSGYGTAPTPTFADIDNAWSQGQPSPYTAGNTPTGTTSPLNSTISTPAGATPVSPPGYDRRARDMYFETFTNPEMFWDEYSQGRGTQFVDQAARGMAKAGRTGMLPTLGNLAHQDYMSQYLPSVRKDLAPGLNWESQWNQNQAQQYGDELGYSQGLYGVDVDKYGKELNYDAAMQDLIVKQNDIDLREKLGELDSTIKTLDINEATRRTLYQSLLGAADKLSAADFQNLVYDLGLTLKTEEFGQRQVAGVDSNTYTDPQTGETWTRMRDGQWVKTGTAAGGPGGINNNYG